MGCELFGETFLKGNSMKAKNIAVVSVVTIMALAVMWPVLAGVKPEQVVKEKDSGGQEAEHPFLSSEELECFYGVFLKSRLMNINDILRGIGPVKVLVEPINPEIEKLGLTTQALQTDVELQLRKYGVAIVKDEWGSGYLYINVNTITNKLGFVALSLAVQYKEPVLPIRNPRVWIPAPVWGVSTVGSVGIGKVKQIRESVKDHVNEFINDYLAANPKEPATKK